MKKPAARKNEQLLEKLDDCLARLGDIQDTLYAVGVSLFYPQVYLVNGSESAYLGRLAMGEELEPEGSMESVLAATPLAFGSLVDLRARSAIVFYGYGGTDPLSTIADAVKSRLERTIEVHTPRGDVLAVPVTLLSWEILPLQSSVGFTFSAIVVGPIECREAA